MKIVFENEHWVAIDKAAGHLSVPSRLGKADPRPVAGLELERALGLQIFPVHRLDLEVSGLLLFAKNAEAHRVANKAFETRSIRKTYQAYSERGANEPTGAKLEWNSLLVRGKKRSFAAPHGQDALTEAEFLGQVALEEQDAWHWRLSPLTGRAHQLRVHMAAFAAPILGDSLYGATAPWRRGGIALRAVTLDATQAPELSSLGLPTRLEVPGF
jgi:23S rRNA-/tRNA-specific pseudouridylate synthase